MRFLKTQKDSKRIYFFLEFIQGVTLEFLLQTVGILTIKDSRFYIACLIIVLQYLHERDVLYRDLNPENIMIDKDGYVKVVDFNSAKVVTGKSYTLVTCPYYIAPEVICGKGYTKLSEVWSLGVLLFEFLCGKVPFGQNQEDPISIYEEVLKGCIEFPSDIPYISENAKNFIGNLLQRYPENRHSGSVEKMKGNPFFIGLDWEEISRKIAIPPYKSEEIDPIDIHNNNFGLDLDLEEFIEGLSDSDESLPPIEDFEISKYVSQIPPNWDSIFE
jgi:cGMP-dependent protein kinase